MYRIPVYTVRFEVPNIVAKTPEHAIDVAIGILTNVGAENLPIEVLDANTGKVLIVEHYPRAGEV